MPSTATTPTAWSQSYPSGLQQIQAVEGPDSYEDTADDFGLFDRSEEAGVLRADAIVAHDPVAILRDFAGRETFRFERRTVRNRAVRQVRLLQLLAVDEHLAVVNFNDLARQTD